MEHFLTCQLCKEGFDHTVILSCGHTICIKCATKYFDLQPSIGNYAVTTFGNSADQMKSVCPVCKEVIHLPGGGAETFPRNRLLENIAKSFQSKSDRKGK